MRVIAAFRRYVCWITIVYFYYYILLFKINSAKVVLFCNFNLEALFYFFCEPMMCVNIK